MTPPERLTITGPEDILGFIPHSLGYWPVNSLVAMTMQGKRLGATLRVDLPCRNSPAELRQFSSSVSEYLEADNDADGTLLVIFTNDGWSSSASPAVGALPGTIVGPGHAGPAGVDRRPDRSDSPERPAAGDQGKLLAALESALASSGMPVRDAWYVGDDFWRNAYCSDPACCPLAGRSVDEIRDSRLNAEMVFRGSSVGEAPAASAPESHPEQPVDLSVMECEGRWAAEFSPRRASRVQFADVLDAWVRVLGSEPGPELPSEIAGYLRASLRVPQWRDAVLVMTAAGRPAAEQGAEDFGVFDQDPGLPAVSPPLDGLPAGDRDEGASGAVHPVPGYGDILLGLAPLVPDWSRMRALERVLLQLGQAGGGEAGAAALTGRGWIEWCRGRGSFADALLNRAAAQHPGYRLAELLAELVRRGTLCGWAARREAAWQRFETDAA
jgi:hypothetical protein